MFLWDNSLPCSILRLLVSAVYKLDQIHHILNIFIILKQAWGTKGTKDYLTKDVQLSAFITIERLLEKLRS